MGADREEEEEEDRGRRKEVARKRKREKSEVKRDWRGVRVCFYVCVLCPW